MKEHENPQTLLVPSAEILEKKLSVINRINAIYKEGKETPELFSLEAQNAELNEKYDFFDREFEENGLVGLKDITGKIIVPALFKSIPTRFIYDDFRNFPVIAENSENKYALIRTDGTGEAVTPFMYEDIRYVEQSSLFEAKINGKYGLINAAGEKLTPFEWDLCYVPFNGIYTLQDGDKYGVYTAFGLYVKPIYDEIEDDENENLHVRKGDTWGYLDEDGNFIDEKNQEKLDETWVLNFNPDFD